MSTCRLLQNQRESLTAIATQRGWQIIAEYNDAGISGAKGRDDRPGLDKALKDATRARYDVLMVWAIDRLGRSLQDLLATMQTLEASKLRAKGIERSIAVESECDRRPIGKIGYLGKDPTVGSAR
jgi:DNA invertase Pin-like site-specific DNA recombinase